MPPATCSTIHIHRRVHNTIRERGPARPWWCRGKGGDVSRSPGAGSSSMQPAAHLHDTSPRGSGRGTRPRSRPGVTTGAARARRPRRAQPPYTSAAGMQ
uniref:Uncharacterized protein n=1 Tax=Micrococcus sp. A7 TaxID=376418 RepID=A0A141AXK1_9MICC|nr:hypothetical protein pLMA7_p00040 [Micrococcus sp. A7]